MQVGGDAFFFQLARLVGPAAGDERERRTCGSERVHLLAANFRRSEAEDAGAPRPTREARACLAQQLFGVIAAKQREGQKR